MIISNKVAGLNKNAKTPS